MTRRQQRLMWISVALLMIAVAAALILRAFNSNITLFFTPTQVAHHEAPSGRSFRIGGLVTQGSLQRDEQTLTVRFKVTDLKETIPVSFTGLLPDLFKEGKGVVAQGALDSSGTFIATEVLAKHDENYVPPQAAAALEEAARNPKK